MMNADEVRSLMPKSVDEIIEEITKNCAEVAKKGKEEFTTWDYEFGQCLESNKKQKEILKGLRAQGFKAEHSVICGQFVDARLRVSWKKEKQE